jgi:hypothetical protein
VISMETVEIAPPLELTAETAAALRPKAAKHRTSNKKVARPAEGAPQLDLDA